MARPRSRKRSRTLDQARARIDSILARMAALAREVEDNDRLMRSKLA
jgi:hypothetical protein